MSADGRYARTVADLGDMRRLAPLELRVPARWKEHHIEAGIADWLTDSYPHLRVHQQLNWGHAIPDLVVVSDPPWLYSLTVIEVKRHVIRRRDVDQLITYMMKAVHRSMRPDVMWSVQGILAAPDIRDGLVLPNWCAYLPIIPVVEP